MQAKSNSTLGEASALAFTDSQADSLAGYASGMAIKAAGEYLRVHNLKVVSLDALNACLKSWIKAKLPEALNDAKEAFACHMDAVAVTTFAATMAQAGIEAAKEASVPPQMQAA